ncbi:MAG: protoporphyrinogen oxidase [Gammaproteobacteria bacterium]|nr:protoporphyrinogen oxidase [Gammaproteobacteria bacterium]
MIAIVGGGMSGLALGRELVRSGRECVVFEADDRPGGIVSSKRVDGLLLESGPQRARLTAPFAALVDELGLGESLILAPRDLDLFIYRDGRLRRVPLSMRGLLKSDAVSWRGKLRAMLEPLTPGARDDERVADFFSRKLGRELYEHVVGPLYGGLYGTDPGDMVVGLSLAGLLRNMGIGRSLVLSRLFRGAPRAPRICSFADGMDSLPRALARALGDRLRLNTPVRAIEPRTGGWSVVLDGETQPAGQVVLAVPAPVAARLLRGIAADASTRIGGLRYNPLAVVHLRADTDLHGIGFQVSLAEPRALRGVTFSHCLFGGEGGRPDRNGVYTAYLAQPAHPRGGPSGSMGDDPAARGRSMEARTNEALGDRAASEFERCTGYGAEPLGVARPSMPAWDTSWSALPGLRLPPGLHVTANWESRPGLTGRFARARALAASLDRDRR